MVKNVVLQIEEKQPIRLISIQGGGPFFCVLWGEIRYKNESRNLKERGVKLTVYYIVETRVF